MGIDTIGPLLVMGVILLGAVLLIRHSVRNYRLHQEEAYAKEQGIEITLPASSRSGPTIGFPEAVFAALVSFFRLTVLPVTHISSHLEARKLFMTLIQVRRSTEGEDQWNTYSDPDDEEEDDEEEMVPMGRIVDQDPVVPLSPGTKTIRLTPEMAAQIVQDRNRSSFRTEEGGRSIILTDLLRDDPRHFLIVMQGFISQIHHLALAQGGKVTRDPFSKNEGPTTYNQKITRKEWDFLIGSTSEPGWLRKAHIIEERVDGSYWPYEDCEDAWLKFAPFLHTCIEDVHHTPSYHPEEREN